MKKEIDYLEIEKFLLDELKGEQLISFKKRLEEDINFANEVALYKEVNATLSHRFSNYEEENKLRNTLEDLGTIHIKKTSNNSSRKELNKKEVKVFSLTNYSKYLVAASLVLFASLLWIYSNKKANYSDFAKFDTIELTVRGENQEHLLAAQNAFNTKEYKKAQKEFELLLKEDTTKVELQLYLAISLLEQNKFELADSMFTKISQGNSVFKNKAIWYLALSKLKQKDYKSCKKELEKLPKTAEDYNKAVKLLSKL